MSWQQVKEVTSQLLEALDSDPYKSTSEGQWAIGTIKGWGEWLDVLQRRGMRAQSPDEQLANYFVLHQLRAARADLRNHAAEPAVSTWQRSSVLGCLVHVGSAIRQLVHREAAAARTYAKQAQSEDVVAAKQVREAASIAVNMQDHKDAILRLQTEFSQKTEAAERKLTEASDLQKKIEDDGKNAARKSNEAIAALTKATEKVREIDGSVSAAEVARDKIKSLLDELTRSRDAASEDIKTAREALADQAKQLDIASEKLAKATADLNRQGLADSFAQQVNRLAVKRDQYERGFWVSIAAVVLFGSVRLACVEWLPLNWLNAALLAPIAFALFWLAWSFSGRTQVISRVVEDYAFKAATALAFEGYKREAASSDPELAKKLLDRAIDHFGKNPTRLMPRVGKAHGSPIEAVTANMVEAVKHGTEAISKVKGGG